MGKHDGNYSLLSPSKHSLIFLIIGIVLLLFLTGNPVGAQENADEPGAVTDLDIEDASLQFMASKTMNIWPSVNHSFTLILSAQNEAAVQKLAGLDEASRALLEQPVNKENPVAYFPEISFSTDDIGKTFDFIVSEEPGDKNYIKYDTTPHVISVTAKKENGVLVLEVRIDDKEAFAVTDPVIEVGDFENEYLAAGKLKLVSSKAIEGTESDKQHKLPFDLWYKKDYPEGDSFITSEVTINEGNTTVFDFDIEFTLDPDKEPTSVEIVEEDGTKLTIFRVSLPYLVETGRAETGTDEDGHTTYTIEYIMIERTVADPWLKPPDQSFDITVTLTDNGDGRISSTAATVKDNKTGKTTSFGEESIQEDIISGEFRDSVRSSASFTVSGRKKIAGRNLKPGDEWTFEIAAVCEKDGKIIECEKESDKGPLPKPGSVTNTSDGSFSFEPVIFTPDHLGPCSMTDDGKSYTCDPKDFIYKVTETGNVKRVDNAILPKTFKVTVSLDEDGNVQVSGPEDLPELLTFTNFFTPKGFIRFGGTKTLTGKTLEERQFSFVVLDGAGTPVETASNEADGSFMFDPIEFTEEGTYNYTVRESGCENKDGITCDTTVYDITVTVSEDLYGELDAEADIDVRSLDFTNTYSAEGSIQFGGTKKLNGMDLGKDQFSFVLLDKEGETLGTVSNGADGSFLFDQIDYTEPGTYTYTVWESGCENKKGITCDTTVYDITVTVTDDEKGHLTPDADIDVSKLDFTNEYHAEGSSIFWGMKNLTGMDLKEEQFSFVLLDKDGKPMETVQNDEDGRFEFGPIYYTAPGTYTYTVKESGCENKDGITCDTTEYRITVTVTDDCHDGTLTARAVADVYRDGTLIEKVDLEVSGMDFTNEYHAVGSMTIKGKKNLIGKDLKEGQFSFAVLDKDGKTVDSQTNGRDGTYYLIVDFTETGTYTYTVRESGCEDAVGITCDTTVYDITVSVTDDNHGVLIPIPDIDISKLDFTNTYTAEGSIRFGGTKKLTGKDLEKDQFSFVLLDKDGETLGTVSNGADGSFLFDQIDYTEPGTYTYTVRESGCEDANGITCDTTVYDITVSVSDDEKSHLAAKADIDVTRLDFTNTYTAKGAIQFSGTITLTGKDLEKDQFSFALLDKDGNVLETVKNDENGKFIFSEIPFSKAGTYYFRVKVSGCEDADGITCDTMVYDITVTVTDDGKGHLTAEAGIDVSKLDFTNSYTETPETPEPYTRIVFHRLPKTGFSSVRSLPLPEQPKDLQYKPLRWILEIPTLSITTDILEVPYDDGNYPVTWLGSAAGLLEGFALPGRGRTILTGHNHLNTMDAGPFSQLWTMDDGDRIFVLDPDGGMQIFSVYTNEKIAADDISGLARISDAFENSLTLITCEDEQIDGEYENRRIIAARPVL